MLRLFAKSNGEAQAYPGQQEATLCFYRKNSFLKRLCYQEKQILKAMFAAFPHTSQMPGFPEVYIMDTRGPGSQM